MARKIRLPTVTMLSDIDEARGHLMSALSLVNHATRKIRSAIKSLDGARRRAERRLEAWRRANPYCISAYSPATKPTPLEQGIAKIARKVRRHL